MRAPYIACPRCGRRSYNPRDIAERYCGFCHKWHADMTPEIACPRCGALNKFAGFRAGSTHSCICGETLTVPGAKAMTPAQEAALHWTCRALAAEIANHASPDEIRERAEQLIAIAEQHGIEIERLVEWIHRRPPGKQWSATEFRGFAGKLAEARQQLASIAQAFGVCLHCGKPIANAESAKTHVCGGLRRE